MGIEEMIYATEAATPVNLRVFSRFRLSRAAADEIATYSGRPVMAADYGYGDRLVGYPFVVDDTLSGVVVRMEEDPEPARKRRLAMLHRGHPVQTPKVFRRNPKTLANLRN